MNAIPKGVFTRKGFKGVERGQPTTAEQATAMDSWADARVFDGDLVEEIKTLKSQPGKPIYAIGGAGFVRNLVATGLVDEYQLVTHPVILGKGMPIFSEVAAAIDLKLVEVKSFPGGIIAHVYRPA